MPENDAQIELKKRARRRLVGAIALALTAAIVLPMVMDSEPKSSGSELQIRIPSQEGGNYASRLINAPPPPPPIAEAPPEALPDAPNSQPIAEPETADTSAPIAIPPVEESKSASKPATKPAESIDRKPPVSPKEKPLDESARAKAILEGAPTLAQAPAVTQFFVQLGAYRDADNVRSLQAKLKAAGYVSTTEKIGDKTRVRAGPFANRHAAEQALAKLKKAGLSGVVAAK